MRYAICDRSGNKTNRGFRCVHSFPRPSENARHPRERLKGKAIVGGMTTRNRSALRESREHLSITGHGGANAMRTPGGFEGKLVCGVTPSPSSAITNEQFSI